MLEEKPKRIWKESTMRHLWRLFWLFWSKRDTSEWMQIFSLLTTWNSNLCAANLIEPPCFTTGLKKCSIKNLQAKHPHPPSGFVYKGGRTQGSSPGIHQKMDFSNLFELLAVMVSRSRTWPSANHLVSADSHFSELSLKSQTNSAFHGRVLLSCNVWAPPGETSFSKSCTQRCRMKSFRESFLVQTPDICVSPSRIHIFVFEPLEEPLPSSSSPEQLHPWLPRAVKSLPSPF